MDFNQIELAIGWIKNVIKNFSRFPGIMIYQFLDFPKQWTEKCLFIMELMQLIFSHIACHPVNFIVCEHSQTATILESAVKSTMHDDSKSSNKQDFGQNEKMHQKFE